MFDHDFSDFLGYRSMVVEDKIDECMRAVRSGETHISIDRGDLTDEEVDYVEKEVKRRARRGF